MNPSPDIQLFANERLAATVRELQARNDLLDEALEWVEGADEAVPLERERRIIFATIAAIKAEFAPGYFDAAAGLQAPGVQAHSTYGSVGAI